MEPVQLAAILAAAVLLASMVSVEIGISVALVELALGVALGNAFVLDANASWLAFIASFASVVLTFLAGAEVDPDDFRERFGASIAIGVVSFAGPFAAATLIALGPLGWSAKVASPWATTTGGTCPSSSVKVSGAHFARAERHGLIAGVLPFQIVTRPASPPLTTGTSVHRP